MSFLETLSRAARTAYPAIQRGVREGLSSRRIDDALRKEFGSSIRRATLLDIMRREQSVVERSERLKFLGLDRRPSPASLAEALTKIRREYSFTVEVTGTMVSTGASLTQHITVTSDTLLTRREIEEAARDLVESDKDQYGVEVESVTITRGMRAGPAGTF